MNNTRVDLIFDSYISFYTITIKFIDSYFK